MGHDCAPPPRFNTLKSEQTARAYAVFGALNYKVTDQINLILGGRYSREDRTLTSQAASSRAAAWARS